MSDEDLNINRMTSPEIAEATNKLIRISPRKLNLVAGLIRGKNVEIALTALSFSHKRIAHDVKKTLESAIANAENNHGLDIDKLYVHSAFVGKRMVMKRLHTRARGRAARVHKFFSSLTIQVMEQ